MGFSAEVADEYQATQAKRKNDNPDKDTLHVSLKRALMAEFPELWDCLKIDVRFLWAGNDGRNRYRLNGWVEHQIIFSRFVVGWMEDKGVQFEIRP